MTGDELLERVRAILARHDPGESAPLPLIEAFSREVNLATAALFDHEGGRPADALRILRTLLGVVAPERRQPWLDLVAELSASTPPRCSPPAPAAGASR